MVARDICQGKKRSAASASRFLFDEDWPLLYDDGLFKHKREDGMDEGKQGQASPYTCNDYRQEMILLAMRRKLQDDSLAEDERRRLREEIARLEKRMGMD
jgi:hypothetical protein